VLLDYHLHLAPDATELRDEHLSVEHLAGYVAAAAARGVTEIGVTEHVYRFREAAGLFDHPYWQEWAQGSLSDYRALLDDARAAGLPLLASLEVDYLAGREAETSSVLGTYDWDYLLGSVHWLGEYAVDHPDYSVWDHASVDAVWESYVDALVAAASSGLFDTMAHPDLAKVFGHRASAPLLPRLYERAAEAFATAEVCAELSTAGLRKAAAEPYPAPAFLATLRRAGVPITLASDAHVVEHVAQDVERALELAHDAGYRTVTQFRARDRRQVPLG
jgi:histidinol-phosphatase (PHP family)